jgi:hypothetical protein
MLLKTRPDVRQDDLEWRVHRALALAFYYEDSSLKGVSAIKKASKSFRRKLRTLADWSNASRTKYEIGWAYTALGYRNRGVAGTLLEILLSAYPCLRTFSMVRTENRIAWSVLSKHGYSQQGSSFLWEGSERVILVREGSDGSWPDQCRLVLKTGGYGE